MSYSIDLKTRAGELSLTTFAFNGLQITTVAPMGSLSNVRGIGYAQLNRDELDELIDLLVYARDHGSYADHPMCRDNLVDQSSDLGRGDA